MMAKSATKTNRFWAFRNIGDETELRISGEIIDEDWAWLYEWFEIAHTAPNRFRDELKEHKGKQIRVWIDSPGGSVFAAAGIYNALKEHDGKVITVVERAMSAASVIAMAGDEIQMSPVGIMMIHNPIGYMDWGEAKDFRHAADVLDEVKETIINAYQLKTGKDRDVISKMMDDETYMSAQKAVAEGFADKVMYTDVDLEGFENNYSFSRFAILNSMSASAKKFLELAQLQAKPPEPVENKTEGEGSSMDPKQIKTVDDLRNVYPELVKQIEDNAKAQGEKAERERIKAIEDIAKNVDPELVAKAKFEEPIDAKELAFKALQADSAKAQDYLKAAIADNKASGVDEVKAAPAADDNEKQPKSIADRFSLVAAQLDARRRGGM